ncbi:hypothetical protein CUMW_031490 [Citrus unshiu]|nr:hypothetical protein CUMW_031490 [Citrus unshiu]
MMGSDNQVFEKAHVYASREEMENLVLDDDNSSSKSFSNYRSATSLSPPILVTPADSDPLLAPPPYRDLRNPNAPDNNGNNQSYIEPPSYADVIFRPFDETNPAVNEINGVESSNQFVDSPHSSASPVSSTSSDYIKITVSNPQKEQEMSNSLGARCNTYVTYLLPPN